jgi:hypothetical protein
LKGIEFPVKITDAPKFAKRVNMSINIYNYFGGYIAPLEVTKEEKEKLIDLLYLKDDNKEHYSWIKDFSRFVGSQVTKRGHGAHFCKMCLNGFNSEAKLADHKTYCSQYKNAVAITPPPFDNAIEFKNFCRSLKLPFVGYADFECMLQKVQTFQPSDETPYTNTYQKHAPTNFAYHIKYANGDYKPPVEYSGIDASKVFYKNLKEDALHIAREYFDKIVPMEPLTGQEKKKFATQKICHICEKPLHVLPPMILKGLLKNTKAINHYTSLGNEKLVTKY